MPCIAEAPDAVRTSSTCRQIDDIALHIGDLGQGRNSSKDRMVYARVSEAGARPGGVQLRLPPTSSLREHHRTGLARAFSDTNTCISISPTYLKPKGSQRALKALHACKSLGSNLVPRSLSRRHWHPGQRSCRGLLFNGLSLYDAKQTRGAADQTFNCPISTPKPHRRCNRIRSFCRMNNAGTSKFFWLKVPRVRVQQLGHG